MTKGSVDRIQEVDRPLVTAAQEPVLVTVARDCSLGMTDVLGCSLGRQQETPHLP